MYPRWWNLYERGCLERLNDTNETNEHPCSSGLLSLLSLRSSLHCIALLSRPLHKQGRQTSIPAPSFPTAARSRGVLSNPARGDLIKSAAHHASPKADLPAILAAPWGHQGLGPHSRARRWPRQRAAGALGTKMQPCNHRESTAEGRRAQLGRRDQRRPRRPIQAIRARRELANDPQCVFQPQEKCAVSSDVRNVPPRARF